MFNKVIMVGRLCKDGEFKMAGQTEMYENTLAVNKKTKDKEKSIFIKIKVFGNAVNVMRAYTKKGDKIGIIGELDFNQWVGQDGKNHYEHSIIVNEIELLGSPKGQAQGQSKAPAQKPAPQARQAQNNPSDELDEIPF